METKVTSQYGVSDYTRDETKFKSEVLPRMTELFNLNKWDWDKHSNEAFDKRMDRQNELIEELEARALEANSMTGRFIKFQCADSYALYLVTKVNKTTCRLQWINWCDGHQDSRLGEEGSLPLEYVHNDICGQDRMKKLFS